MFVKVRQAAKIRNRCNQVPHLTQDTTCESDKNTRKNHIHIQESQDVSPFNAGDHKTARNRLLMVGNQQLQMVLPFRPHDQDDRHPHMW